MADVTIDNLPLQVGLSGTERVPIAVDTGFGFTTKCTTTGAIAEAATQAEYLLLGTSVSLPTARVLSGTSGQITLTDNGAGNTAVLSLANSGATAGTYGDSTHLVSLTVDAKGRITAISNIDLNASFQTYLQNLPTSLPAQPNIPWNNGGIVSIS